MPFVQRILRSSGKVLPTPKNANKVVRRYLFGPINENKLGTSSEFVEKLPIYLERLAWK